MEKCGIWSHETEMGWNASLAEGKGNFPLDLSEASASPWALRPWSWAPQGTPWRNAGGRVPWGLAACHCCLSLTSGAGRSRNSGVAAHSLGVSHAPYSSQCQRRLSNLTLISIQDSIQCSSWKDIYRHGSSEQDQKVTLCENKKLFCQD